MEDFTNDMDGIVADVRPHRLDEAPQAYKQPEAVMAAQSQLTEVIDQIKPFICVKG